MDASREDSSCKTDHSICICDFIVTGLPHGRVGAWACMGTPLYERAVCCPARHGSSRFFLLALRCARYVRAENRKERPLTTISFV